jgi:hypothetical protein
MTTNSTILKTIPKGFVAKNFDMDPETDDIIRGRYLQHGMIVLIEESIMRENPSKHVDDNPHDCDNYECQRIKETSQWCMVSDLSRKGEITSFVGIYSDGVKRSRIYNESYFWLVKKESR